MQKKKFNINLENKERCFIKLKHSELIFYKKNFSLSDCIKILRKKPLIYNQEDDLKYTDLEV